MPTAPARAFDFSLFLRGQSDLIPEARSTWDRGGCWTLAEAIRLWLGDATELWELASSKGAPHHVIAKAGDWFIDSRGFQDEARLCATWARHHPAEPLFLQPFDPAAAATHDLYCDEHAARTLARRLKRAIPPASLGLESAPSPAL